MMKQRGRVKKLKIRQVVYDVMVKANPVLAPSYKRPGSLKEG